MSNQPNKNNPSHPPSKVPPGRGPPRMVPQPNNPPSSFDYNGPPGGFSIRGDPIQDPLGGGAAENPEIPSFRSPASFAQNEQMRTRDDRGPAGQSFAPPVSIPTGEPDFLQGGNLVGPEQLQNAVGTTGLSGPANAGRQDPQGRPRPRHDPIGPFPGMGKPNNDHMKPPGPRGFGPGGMM